MVRMMVSSGAPVKLAMMALLALGIGLVVGHSQSAGVVCLDGTPPLPSGTDFLPVEVCVDSVTGLVSRISAGERKEATQPFSTAIGTVLGGCTNAAAPVVSHSSAGVKVTRALTCPQPPSGQVLLWATVVDTYSVVSGPLVLLPSSIHSYARMCFTQS
jgi:hypothetical protein